MCRGPCISAVAAGRHVLPLRATSLVLTIQFVLVRQLFIGSEVLSIGMVPARIFMKNSVDSLIWWSSHVYVEAHMLMLRS